MFVVAALSACLATGARGQSSEGKSSESDHIGAHSALTPQKFASEAGSAGLAEVELSRMALAKSTDAAVKQFAQMMIEDHTKANNELVALTTGRKIDMPTELKPEQTAAADKLRRESGAAFDRAYAAQMVEDHRKAVELFREASEAEHLEADIRQFAEKKLPTLEHHHQQAIALKATLQQQPQARR
jgi:putative membrane protein